MQINYATSTSQNIMLLLKRMSDQIALTWEEGMKY